MPNGFFEVDDSDVQRMVHSFNTLLRAEMYSLLSTARSVTKNALIFSIESAASSQPNFPSIYTEHIVSVVEMMYMPIKITGDGFIWEFSWGELGTRSDLVLGYHQGAAIQGGGHIELGEPYSGQPLKNPFATRYKAWQHIASGENWVTQKVNKRTGKLGKPRVWNVEGKYDATLEARVSIWGLMSAPEWLILDNGTPHYPVVAPTMFSEKATDLIMGELQALYINAVEAAQYQADRLSSMGTISKRESQTQSEFLREKSYLQARSRGRFSGGYW